MNKSTQPSIKKLIDSYTILPKRSLGQNFLIDSNILKKIANINGSLKSEIVLEIGPGPGSLTRELLETKAKKIIVVEKDSRCIKILQELKKIDPKRLEILNKDILKFNGENITNKKIYVIGNLPFNIATKIITNYLLTDNWPPFFSSLTLMLQKEVAERIVARPNTKTYGRLSVICQWRCEIKKLLEIKASVFFPRPKVDSILLKFIPRKNNFINTNFKVLEKVVFLAFNQRRKMIHSSLKKVDINIINILKDLKIDCHQRAENLTINDYCKISNKLLVKGVKTKN